ncbi:hypothetical protein HYS28_03165 [Candidatus Uhrbacteria bacterium]|nr:hypothetical protein [Candidatus Uhrbacteria bacterium]
MSPIQSSLVKLGLTETEARVYLAMLKLGPDTVQHIAREAKISRTAAYEIISTLEKKGLASSFTQGKRKNFTAEEPEKLESYFEGRIRDIQSELGTLNRILPEIRLLQGGSSKPRVRYYKGDEAVRALFRDVALVEPTEVYEVSNLDIVYSALDAKLLSSEKKQIDYSKITTRILHCGTPINPMQNVQLRELSQPLCEFQGDIWVYANRVAFVHFYGKVEVVIIDNQIFADTMKALFMAAWEKAPVTKAVKTTKK